MRKETLSSRSSVLSKLVSVIHVWIVVFGDHHPVGKLAASESLHGFLTVCSGDVLHEDLKEKNKSDGSWMTWRTLLNFMDFLTFVKSLLLYWKHSKHFHILFSCLSKLSTVASSSPCYGASKYNGLITAPWGQGAENMLLYFFSWRELRFYSMFSPDDHRGQQWALSAFNISKLKCSSCLFYVVFCVWPQLARHFDCGKGKKD